MKKTKNQNLAIALTLLLFTVFCASLSSVMPNNAQKETTVNKLSESEMQNKISAMEMPFIENVGQINEKVKYYAQLKMGTVFVDNEGALTYKMSNKEKAYVIKETLVGKQKLNPTGAEKSTSTISSFIGNDKSKWHSNIPNYFGVSLGETYEGITVALKAHNTNVEKIFTVNPNQDPSQIKLQLEGAEKLQINNNGELEIIAGDVAVAMSKPIAFQEENNTKIPVEVAYNILDESTYGFKVGSYDTTKALIIDPLIASTYLGGSEDSEEGNGYVGGSSQLLVAFDGATEYVYVGAITYSNDFPTSVGAYDTTQGGISDNFIAKLDLGLTTLVAGTYIGGSTNEGRATIGMAPDGNIFTAARSNGTDYPIVDAFPGNPTIDSYQTSRSGTTYDMVITKIDPDLTTILASTYLGGTNAEWNTSIDFGTTGCPINTSTLVAPPYCVYVAADGKVGTPTTAINLASGYDPSYNGAASTNKFIALLDDNVTNQYYTATFLGQGIYPALEVGESGKVYIHGVASTSDPIVRANGATPSYQETSNGSNEAYVARLSADLTTLEASSFFGGTGYDIDFINSIRTFGSGANEQVFIIADTSNGGLLQTSVTANPNTTSINTFGNVTNVSEDDTYVARFNPDLTNARVAIIGGGATENLPFMDLDPAGNAYVVSGGWSTDYPTTEGAYQVTDPDGVDSDFMITKFNNDLTQNIASTYIGGADYDSLPCGLEISSSNDVYICGETNSTDYPTTVGAYDSSLGGGYDLVISRFTQSLSFADIPPGAVSNLAATPGDSSATLTWSAPLTNGNPLTSYEVHYSNDGFVSDDQTCITPECTDSTAGANVSGLTNGIEYSFRIYAYNAFGAGGVSNTATATPVADVAYPIEIHLTSSATSSNVSTGIADGNTGTQDINSFGTPLSPVAFSALLPTAVGFSFDGLGAPTESSTSYNPLTLTGARTLVVLSDDEVSSDITLPFAISMYGRNNDTLRISSNGFVYLNQGTVASADSRCCSGQLMSSITDTNDHVIAGNWADLYPPGSGEISYETIGNTPNRTFVVQFDNISKCCDALGGNSYQIQLHEQAAGPSAPDPISDLKADGRNSEVVLSWTAPNDNGDPLTSYEVHYSNDGFATDDQTCVTPDCTDLTTNATITGLTNGTTYSFRVYSYNGNGISLSSNTVLTWPGVISGTPAKWPTPASPYDTPISNTNDDESYPQVIRTSDGNYMVIYDRYSDLDSTTSIYAQKINVTNGSTIWASPTRITQTGNQSITSGDWKADNAGGAFIAWTDTVAIFPDFEGDVYVQKIDTNGNLVWGSDVNVTLDNLTALGEGQPVLQSDGSGGVYVVWRVSSSGFTVSDIYMTHLDSTGAVATNWNTAALDEFRSTHVEDGTGDQESPGHDIWLQADGNIAVTYSRSATGAITAEMIVVQQEGASQGPSVLLSNSSDYIGQFRAYPYGGYGAFAVFLTNGDVYAQRVDDNWLKEWGATGLIASSMDGDNINVVPDGSGGIIAIWNYYEGADGADVYAQHVLSNGTVDPAWGLSDISVTPNGDGYSTTIGSQYISSASDSGGGAIVIINSGDDNTVRVQQINANGTIEFGGSGYYLGSESSGGDSSPSLASNGTNGAAVTWFGLNGGTLGDIFGQYFIFATAADAPLAIATLEAAAGDGQVTLNWSAPSDNGYPITDYIVQYDDGSGYQTFPDGVGTSTTVIVTGLINFQSYDFRVYAVNENGTGPASNIVTAIPAPCVLNRSNFEADDDPLTTISDQCLGVDILSGGLSLPYVPDSFIFPRKFSSVLQQDSFSNDNPATRSTVDVEIGPEDVLTASDLTGTAFGFNVTITASAFSNGTDTLPLQNLYVATTAPNTTTLNALNPDLNGTLNSGNQIVYAAGSSGTNVVSNTATLGDLNLASSYTGDGVSFDADSNEIPDIITLMNGPNGTAHMLSASQALSFYLNIPANQPSGNYSILFTVDISSTP
ncbi:fibronectin type III domain-containing protein [Candidatus Peregrinibacteria bacterium]|nr:fibronectin type III domain-containing protein [Candidatus Peregrinibacteria bacterium]